MAYVCSPLYYHGPYEKGGKKGRKLVENFIIDQAAISALRSAIFFPKFIISSSFTKSTPSVESRRHVAPKISIKMKFFSYLQFPLRFLIYYSVS